VDLLETTDKFASVPGLATAHGADDNAVRMGREIERKFLVRSAGWRQEATSTRPLRQGYLAIDDGNNVRVRTDGQRAWLTIKGRGEGITRPEFEYEIPVPDATELLALCRGRIVKKTRHLVPVGALSWEIDEFTGDNVGLVVAEIELPDEDTPVPQPVWLGEEVTADPRYLNANLAVHPFARWAR
jgi:adenylate cyclase